MRLAADLGVRLNSMLQDLGKAAEGIRGSVLVDRSGLPIAGTVRAKQDLNVIAAMSTMITRSATRVFESLGLHHPGIIIMEGREANVAAVEFADGTMSLLTILEKDANLGLVKLEIMRIIAGVEEVLGFRRTGTGHIAELFLMYSDGRLIRHYSDTLRTDIDRDVLSGMLTAIQGIIKQTLASKQGNLDEMKYGEHTVCFVRGAYTIAAVVVDGRDVEGAKYAVSDALQDFEDKYRSKLTNWDGMMEYFAGVDDVFGKVLRDGSSLH